MNKIWWPVLLALALSACESTPDTKATVEDRTAAKGETGGTITAPPAASVAGDAKAAAKGAETTALGDGAVSGAAIDSKPLAGSKPSFSGDPRKDPASPLSKRIIYFEFDSYEVKPEYQPVLEAHAGYLLAKRDAKVILQGHADERGSREYNLALGQKRAEAVRKSLMVLGVTDVQLESVSFGEEKPRSEEKTEEGYAENRRVEVIYVDE
jgi:peptidoglycan-associated lipoprotein